MIYLKYIYDSSGSIRFFLIELLMPRRTRPPPTHSASGIPARLLTVCNRLIKQAEHWSLNYYQYTQRLYQLTFKPGFDDFD